MAKPIHLDWEGTNGLTEPSAGKKLAGWASAEKPAFQYMNWIHNIGDLWHKYLDPFTIAEGAYNVGVVYNGSGEFKLVQANGDDFTSDEPGFIVMKSQVTPGRKKILEITAATHLFVDEAGASDILGEEFGTTAGTAWGNERPFFIYAVNRNDTDAGLSFAISPSPCCVLSPATANIGYHGNPMATPSDDGFFFLTDTNVTATHNEKPCLLIGGIDMLKSSADDWTVQAIAERSGIGEIALKGIFSTWYAHPQGQMGAVAGQYTYSNGGTAPLFNETQAYYKINPDGMCDEQYRMVDDPGTDGAGAVTLRIALAYQTALALGSTNSVFNGRMLAISTGGAATTQFCDCQTVNATKYFTLVEPAGASMQNADFGNGSRQISGTIRFPAFRTAL